MKNFLIILASAAMLFASCSTTKQNEQQPNVAIIFIDDMGFADPSCFGNPAMTTPHIDSLAASGMKFTNFYVNSPICSPSRVALNTGQYPMRYKIHSFLSTRRHNENRRMNHFLDPSAPTIAKTLKANGYATGHFGKWHMGGGRDVGNAPLPQAYGFDKSLVSFEGLGDRILWPNHKMADKSVEHGQGKLLREPKHRTTEIYVDSALSFVNNVGDKPFYVHLFPNDVHDAHLPKEGAEDEFKDVTNHFYEQKFFAVLKEMDVQIGRFIKGLEDAGKLDNTIIIFTSDNGPTDWPWYTKPGRYPEDYEGEMSPTGFTGPYFGRKWSLYEGGIRMPFIISWKGKVPAGVTDSTTIASAFDLHPSLCEMLNVDTPAGLDGNDKSTAFLGEPLENVPALMWEYSSNPGGSIKPGTKKYRSPVLAIRDGDWKLLCNNDSSRIE